MEIMTPTIFLLQEPGVESSPVAHTTRASEGAMNRGFLRPQPLAGRGPHGGGCSFAGRCLSRKLASNARAVTECAS
jgi:hypothetical protein